MMLRSSRLTRAWHQFFGDRCPMMAAAIAYQVLFAIIPITALLVAGVGWTLRAPDVRAEVVRRVVGRIPLDRNLVVDAIRTVSQSGQPLTFVGMILLVWTAIGMFSTVRNSLNIAWGVEGQSFVHQRLIDAAAIVALTLLVLFSILGTSAFHGFASPSAALWGRTLPDFDRLWSIVSGAVPAVATYAMFLLAYRFGPNVPHGFRDVMPGAFLSTLLFELAKHAFTLYVTRFVHYEVLYGSLGAVLLFQLWIYVSALIFLAGAELNSAGWRAAGAA